MAIDMETGEWFSMGALLEGMNPDQQKRYLEATGEALNNAIETAEHGGEVDIKAVNRIIMGGAQVEESIASLDPDSEPK